MTERLGALNALTFSFSSMAAASQGLQDLLLGQRLCPTLMGLRSLQRPSCDTILDTSGPMLSLKDKTSGSKVTKQLVCNVLLADLLLNMLAMLRPP